MSEPQTATILVTDLVGSTALRVTLGEEGADQLRRQHDEMLTRSVEAGRGVVVKGLGDGILAMFTGASDAVSAAVTIQQAAYAHNLDHPDRQVSIRIGLSAGDVSIEGGDCFGTPVVEASRLCAAALGDQILAAELVRLLARGRGGHAFTAAGDRELKGLPDPVPVVVVGWEPPEPTGSGLAFPARIASQPPLPFSGRAPQFEALVQRWKETTGGEQHMALVSGEAGIGKTRLVTEVARQAHDLGAVVLFGRCDEDMGVPFQPFVEALEQVLTSEPRVETLGRHAAELVRLVPELAQVVPGLGPPLQADPETERYRLFDAVVAWLAALSAPNGAVLVLDDLHWAEKSTLLLLRHLVRAPEPMRLLIVGTYRDTDLDRTHPLAEVLADLRREPSVERVALGGLDEDGVHELLVKASGARMDERASQLAHLLWTETEGNPFFVQEILRNLLESGHLVQRDGVWTTDAELSDLGIPEGVREVIGRRLSRLSDATNGVLALASVIGTTVDVDVLVALSDEAEDAILDALDEAVAASLLRETATGAYEFTHALVRSTLYEELSATRRARRHRQVAQALEAQGTADASLLWHHLRRAGITDLRSLDHAVAAGDQALDQLAADQAVTTFTQALEAADDLDVDATQRVDLLIRLGRAQRAAGIPAYRQVLLDAAHLAEGVGDVDRLTRAVLANSQGWWSAFGTIDEAVLATVEAALDAVGPTDSPERARLLARLALERLWRDPDGQRFAAADEAVAMARRLGDDPCLLEVWTAQLISAWTADRDPDIVAELPALLELADRIGDAEQTVLTCAYGFARALEMGDLVLMDRFLDRMGDIAGEANNPVFLWLHAIYTAARITVTGTGDEIEQAAQAALDMGTQAGQKEAFFWYGGQLFGARYAQGRLGEIVEVIRQIATDAPEMPVWRAMLAMALVSAGADDEATTIVDELTADLAHSFPDDFLRPTGHFLLAAAIVGVGTPEQAAQVHAALTPLDGRLPTVGSVASPSISHVLGTLAARAGWPEQAERHFAAAHDQHLRLGAPVWRARTELAWGRVLLETGDTARARELLIAAHDGGRRMGAADITRDAAALLAPLET